MVKNNSFYLRVEKCDPLFYDRLNFQVDKMLKEECNPGSNEPARPVTPRNWPFGALYDYFQRPNPHLQREMDKAYRHWHDSRCGMHELYGRLRAVQHQQQQA